MDEYVDLSSAQRVRDLLRFRPALDEDETLLAARELSDASGRLANVCTEIEVQVALE